MRWLFLLILIVPSFLFAQNFDFGGTIGVSLTFGTQVNRIGIIAKGYTTYNQFQLNAQTTNFFNLKTFGIAEGGLESQNSVGFIYGFGGNDLDDFIAMIDILGNQTGQKNHIGYAYNFYNDVHRMNQKTGTISMQFNRLTFITENDAFSFIPHDRYRTAGAAFRYRLDEFTYLALQMTLWTGDPFYMTVQPIYDDYPNPSGYEDMSGSRFTNNSHGIIAAQVIRLLPYQQQVSTNVGIDAEQIRHALQNRFIHDLPFIPKGWNPPRQPHIPMVAEDGKPYLYQEGQVIRKARFWGNVNMNMPYFY
ncbi:MAG: polymorphic toxin type 23 domain-containing protein [Saprospiraceae bacterium]